MSNPPKYVEHGLVYLVSSRTEEGLPFLDKVRFGPILESIMARAQALYPVTIIAYELSENHFHQLLSPINPADFPLFVGYVKQELAHAVNRIRGRRKKTVWCDGYDSPILLGPDEVFHYIGYCYTQAQAAHQADAIEDSPNPSSWSLYVSGIYQKVCKRLFRTDYRRGLDRDEERLVSRQSHTLTICPFGWLKRLAPQMSKEQAAEEVLKAIRDQEARLRDERAKEDIPILDGSSTSADRAESYVPNKFGERTVCIGWDLVVRNRFLAGFRAGCNECRRVLALWRKGDRTVPWPAGFFPPHLPLLVSVVPE